MAYRFVVNTANGLQNFLKVNETNNGDLVVSQKIEHERLDLSKDIPAGNPADREKSSITVHPNLQSNSGTISINYKTNKNGQETSREVTSVLEVRQGLRLFPVLSIIGENVVSPRLTIEPTENKKDVLLELWQGQQLDWSIQSLAYCIFVASPEIAFIQPQNFPREIHYLRFKHLQLIFMYWAIDKPTKGASITLTVFEPTGQALSGFELHEVTSITDKASEEYCNNYPRIPELTQGQLPKKLLQQTGVKVVNGKWHFNNFSYGLETHRDESLLRLKFRNVDGNEAIIDFNGEDITKFQNQLNYGIKTVPGLAEWKKKQR